MICGKMVKDGEGLLASSFVNDPKYFSSNTSEQDTEMYSELCKRLCNISSFPRSSDK